MTVFSRRHSLGFLAAAPFLSLPKISFAQGTTDRKFIFVILRGGMDGLAALIPDDKEIEGDAPKFR